MLDRSSCLRCKCSSGAIHSSLACLPHIQAQVGDFTGTRPCVRAVCEMQMLQQGVYYL